MALGAVLPTLDPVQDQQALNALQAGISAPERDTACAICLMDYFEDNGAATGALLQARCCNKVFHEQCLGGWAQQKVLLHQNFTCPACVQTLDGSRFGVHAHHGIGQGPQQARNQVELNLFNRGLFTAGLIVSSPYLALTMPLVYVAYVYSGGAIGQAAQTMADNLFLDVIITMRTALVGGALLGLARWSWARLTV